MTVVPYKDQSTGKKEQVARMFDNISKRYDFLNHFLSLGIDVSWRKKAIKMLESESPDYILDIATGTGDFALQAMSLKPRKIVGVDISKGMLEIGREKVARKGLEDIIDLQSGDSENLNFEDNKFDAVIVSFGVRNFENRSKGLKEMYRVLKPGGTVIVLEFSEPQHFPFKHLYAGYFNWILPTIGKFVSRDKSAYQYLPDSVKHFPYGNKFLEELTGVGFNNGICKALTFGISSIYRAKK